MRFIKMQGLGNDFVIIDGFAYADLGDVCSLAKRMCDRHFGVGADGLIWITPSPRADARMRIFNADGTEAETCGNGLRCTAKFMRDTGIAKSDEMRIDTLAGVAIARIEGGLVSVDMGAPRLKPREIPVDAPDNRVEIEAGGRKLNFFCVNYRSCVLQRFHKTAPPFCQPGVSGCPIENKSDFRKGNRLDSLRFFYRIAAATALCAHAFARIKQ